MSPLFLVLYAQARVVLMKTEKMCSVAFKDKHTQEVTVPASSSVAVHYTIVPLEVGNLPLEVTAFAKGMVGSDRTQKSLRVVVSLSWSKICFIKQI